MYEYIYKGNLQEPIQIQFFHYFRLRVFEGIVNIEGFNGNAAFEGYVYIVVFLIC